MRKSLICAVVCLLALLGLLIWNDGRQVESAASSRDLSAGATRSIAEVTPSVSSAVGGEPMQTPTVRGTLPYVLASETPFDKPMRLAVEASGARTLGILSKREMLIEADPVTRTRLSADRRFKALEEYRPSRKIEPALARRLQEQSTESLEVTVVALADADRDQLMRLAVANGCEILKGCLNAANTFKARMTPSVVNQFALRGDVQWMECFKRPHLMNDVAVNPEAMNVRSVWDAHGLSGAGQVITTSDSGIRYDELNERVVHRDLVNQVIGIKVSKGCVLNDLNGHGTHTAGSLVGDGTESEGQIRGTAWGAKLISWFCSTGDAGIHTPEDVNELFRPTKEEPTEIEEGIEGEEGGEGEYGYTESKVDLIFPESYAAYIHSASWGADVNGAYTSECAEFDRYVWKNPDFLPVISAGNAGSDKQTIASPASAKNVLAVGATQNLRTEPRQRDLENGDPSISAEYSSRGPCVDGRIKPDVAAPGTGVLSTRALGLDYGFGVYDDYYAYDTGTSMACPLTAGSIALVREWLLKRPEFSEADEARRPTSALMKAVVMGGARGNEEGKPDNDQGWGRVDLEETLFPSNRAVKLIDRIPFVAREELAWAIKTTNAAPLEVQLVWIDYPGVPGAEQELVNDLDLIVTCRDEGKTGYWYGNGGDLPDAVNNAESVRIAEAPAATYIIIVDCNSVLHDYLEGGAAALYIRGAFDPNAETPVDPLIRIRERNLGFQSLKYAVQKVHEGETIEVLDHALLPQNLMITNSCTIMSAENGGKPWRIARPLEGLITLQSVRSDGKGIRVLFDNLIFTSEEGDASTALCAVGTTTAALRDVTGLGRVLVYDAKGLELAGPLSDPLWVDCRETSGRGVKFAKASVDPEVVGDSAAYLLNPYNTEAAGLVSVDEDDTTILIWNDDVVPPQETAIASYDDGTGPRYFRTLRQLFAAVGGDGEVVIYKDCELTNTVTVSQTLRITSDPVGRTLTVSGLGALTVSSSGSLTLAEIGVTAGDIRRTHLITVDGGELTLDDGTDIHDIAGKKCSTIYVQNNGVVKMLEGSLIRNCLCETDKTALVNSAGICLSKSGCLLEMTGGTITGCNSAYYGAGMFVNPGAEVRVSGSASVYGNTYNTRENNVYLYNKLSRLVLAGEAYGYIGVEFQTGLAALNAEGGIFASIDSGLSAEEIEASLLTFFCDYAGSGKPELVAVQTEDGTQLMWALAPEGPQPVPELVADVRLVPADGSEPKCYLTVEEGFIVAHDGDRLELVHDADFYTDLIVTNAASLVFDGCGYTLNRRADASIFVPEGTALTLTNLTVSGANGGTTAMIRVNSGELTLDDGAVIADVAGDGDRARSGVVVWQGVFTMNPGAEIRNCSNAFIREKDGTGCGGGLLVDGGIAYLNGGTITGCSAYRAGGVFIGNKSTAYVCGDLSVFDNFDLAGEASDLIVHDLESRLVLTNALTGGIGFLPGISADPNLIGHVDPDYFETAADSQLAADAARFTHDQTGDFGVVVTNETSALLVWSSAVDTNGIFIASDEQQYGMLEGGEEVSVVPPAAIEGLVYSAEEQIGVANGIGYALTGNVATNAGDYVATATLRRSCVWTDGTRDPKTVSWSIDRAPLSIIPDALSKKHGASDPELTFTGEGLLGEDVVADAVEGALTREPGEDPGTYAIRRGTLTEAEGGNYEITFFDTTIVFTIENEEAPPEPEEPIVCVPFAFTAIKDTPEGWLLTLAPGVPSCSYALVTSDDLDAWTTNAPVTLQESDISGATSNFTFTVPSTAVKKFWKVVGNDGVKNP